VNALSEAARSRQAANRTAFPGLFRRCAPPVAFYSDGMLPIVLFAPLLRLAPRAWAWTLVLACGLLASAWPANAEEEAAPLATALIEQVRTLALGGTQPAGAARVEVVVGQLDPRLHLAPCERIEPYLPANARLWGKSRIGLRCKEGRSAWNVYLPIVVKVWGRALVVPAGAAAGSILADSDLDEAEVDLAEEFTPAFFDRKLVVGRTLAQALRPGQAVRQAHIKSRQWFAAGETVKLVAVGEGFALESVGQALTNGIEGQPARVRTENGRVVTGVPAGERRMELTL
jgi:flagella basal body P-ring formation protein FlgA